MSERYSDDADWATAAEQSSEEDEAQEGNVLAEEELSVTPAEHVAVHVEDEDGEEDDTVDTDIDIDDPEADAIVNDALEIDEAAEAEAAAEVLSDALAELRTEAARSADLLRRVLEEVKLHRGDLMADPAEEPPPPHY